MPTEQEMDWAHYKAPKVYMRQRNVDNIITVQQHHKIKVKNWQSTGI